MTMMMIMIMTNNRHNTALCCVPPVARFGYDLTEHQRVRNIGIDHKVSYSLRCVHMWIMTDKYVDYCSRPARAVQCAIKTAKYWKNTVEQITLCPSQNAVGYFVRDSAGLHDTPLSNFALYSPLCGLAQWLARWLRSTKLIYAGPGYNVLRRVTVSGFNSRCRTLTSVCSQPATQGQLSFPSLRGR